jgi:ribonuclease J
MIISCFIFDELHVSGHAFCEDHYEMLKPTYVIAAHGGLDITSDYVNLARDFLVYVE